MERPPYGAGQHQAISTRGPTLAQKAPGPPKTFWDTNVSQSRRTDTVPLTGEPGGGRRALEERKGVRVQRVQSLCVGRVGR